MKNHRLCRWVPFSFGKAQAGAGRRGTKKARRKIRRAGCRMAERVTLECFLQHAYFNGENEL